MSHDDDDDCGEEEGDDDAAKYLVLLLLGGPRRVPRRNAELRRAVSVVKPDTRLDIMMMARISRPVTVFLMIIPPEMRTPMVEMMGRIEKQIFDFWDR
jgi:hypothetical protein